MADSQKISTTSIDGFWDYKGSYNGEIVKVRKIDTHKWEGTIEGIAGTDKRAKKKKTVVNILVDEIDDIIATENSEASNDYKETVYEGNPMFSVDLVKEEDYNYNERKKIKSKDDIADFLRPYFDGADREKAVILLLDAGNSVIGLHELSVGGMTSTTIDVRNVMKVALLANATGIVMAHNHPSGNPEPSRADIKITRSIRDAGNTMDIKLLDHIVIGDSLSTSLRERGVI